MTILETERLILRSPELGDAQDLAAALNDFEISKNLATVPYPYTEDDAYAFVGKTSESLSKGEAHGFVIRRQKDDAFVGCCGLHLKDGSYELGYWIAKPFWRQGYASEAARVLVAFGFDELNAGEITAGWYHDNGISGRILYNLGFKAVRVEKQHCRARDQVVLCNRTKLTREDFGQNRMKPVQSHWPQALRA